MYFCSETIYVFALRASLRWCKCVCMCICASAVVSRCLCLCVSHFAFCVAIYPYYSMHTECIKEIFGEMTIFQPASTHYTHLHSHKSARAFIVISYICIYGFWIHLFTLVIGHSDDDTMICNNNNSNERKKMRILFFALLVPYTSAEYITVGREVLWVCTRFGLLMPFETQNDII